ncbi:probable regulatory protein afsR [Rhodopirellula baltica SH 1]|uniref:Probable regulatory protein afsR n=2 Tax=Rhodopirellula baltica TaxID=265606 RepID=Q7UEH8_RHOBA|nr:probable regulatory protein afsR [Rhodopirellula baltica SH 1]
MDCDMSRHSEAALAWITRLNDSGAVEVLTQWNSRWQRYSLIGGHVEIGESFHQACRREITEELECTEAAVEVAPYPYATMQFREYSQAAKAETQYHWQAFMVRLSDAVLEQIPGNCRWVTESQIRSGRTASNESIADQARSVFKAIEQAEFDLFVSYGHKDNEDASVTALVEHIRREHEQFVPNEPLKIFFDLWGIESSDDWEKRIYRGLIESKTMLAVLSPAYFGSPWCRREYDTFVLQQKKKLYPGEPIHAIYIQEHADFDRDDDHPQRSWFETLKRHQFLDAKPWWPDGQVALQREVVTGRLQGLRKKIWNQVCDVRSIQNSPTNLTAFNINFVGRERESTQLWNMLRMDHVTAISAIQGVGGLGKTALARAFAHTRRREYLGGQFEIGMEKVTSADQLRLEIVQLANLYLGASIPDELANTNLPAAFAKAKAAFERPGQGKILLILDNVAADGILAQRSQSLPSPEFVHVLATTRLDPARWGIESLHLDALSTEDALDLFQKYRPFATPGTDNLAWQRVRRGDELLLNDQTETDSAEWKAAVRLVNQLGCHALAVEVVAIYLGHNRSISLQDYYAGLVKKGLSVKLAQAGDDPAVRARLSQEIETNVAQLLEPTFARLEQDCPLALRVLEWAALMPADHVPWIWLFQLLEESEPESLDHDPDDPDPWDDGVRRLLAGWRILNGEPQAPIARQHRIVQAALRRRTWPDLSNSECKDRLDSKLSKLFILVHEHAKSLLKGVLQDKSHWELHAIENLANSWTEYAPDQSAILLHELCNWQLSAENWTSAEQLVRDAIALHENSRIAGHQSLAHLYKNLARALTERRRFDEAQEVIEKIVELDQVPYAFEQERECAILQASLAFAQGNFDVAATCLSEFLGYESKTSRCVVSENATETFNLATCFLMLKRLEESEKLARLLLAHSLSNSDRDLEYKAHDLLGQCLLKSNRTEDGEAQQHLEFAMEAVKKKYGKSSPAYARIAINLAVVLKERGEFEEAAALNDLASITFEDTLEHGDPLLSVLKTNVGQIYRSLGRYDEALREIKKAAQIVCDNRKSSGVKCKEFDLVFGVLFGLFEDLKLSAGSIVKHLHSIGFLGAWCDIDEGDWSTAIGALSISRESMRFDRIRRKQIRKSKDRARKRNRKKK